MTHHLCSRKEKCWHPCCAELYGVWFFFISTFFLDEITSLAGLKRMSTTCHHPSQTPASLLWSHSAGFSLRPVPSLPLYVACFVELFCVTMLPHQKCCWRPNSGEVMVVRGSQVSRGRGGGSGVGFVKKSRNSSGWQMKSVHSSKAAPFWQPVEQSQKLNEGQDNGGTQCWTPPIENWRERQKESTICLTLGEELSFYPPRL